MSHERVTYWTEEWPKRNFGDFLSEYIVERALLAPIVPADLYRLIGSVIDNDVLRGDLARCDRESPRIALWCCGKRDDQPLAADVNAHCLFLGARGPLTRDCLGLPQDTPLGDPALLLPLVFAPKPTIGNHTVCVPHFQEPCDSAILLRQCGCDMLISPAVGSMKELEELVEVIATADFVLAGALHAAIVAVAYGRPFAYWDTGYVDVPFKWHDFAASLGVTAPRVATVVQGRAAYADMASAIKVPSLVDILGCCPFAVRPEVFATAVAREAGLDKDYVSRLSDIGARSFLSRADRGIFRQPAADRDEAERDAGLRAARIDGALANLDSTLGWLKAEAAALRFSFQDEPELKMSSGSAGIAFLGNGWSSPNEIGPWSEGSYSYVRLPASTGWHKASELIISGYAFSPSATLSDGQCIEVRLNDIPIFSDVIDPMNNRSRFVSLHVPIPEKLRNRGGWLVIGFVFSSPVSPMSLDIGTDQRQIAFALSSIKSAGSSVID